jgi:3-methyl-2-oxobutanoate hydroxymethyltransferase
MMVKLEGGHGQTAIVEHLTHYDVPVCAHLGLKPQSVHKIGGFKVQGREDQAAQQMVEEAQALEAAGADVVLLECVPRDVGRAICAALHVPVIGIGAGPDVDGQILVLYDVLGVTQGRMPRFVRNFMRDRSAPLDALRDYVQAVKDRGYPTEEHWFS